MAFKVDNTIAVILESPEGNAEIKFRKLLSNEVYDLLYDIKEGKRLQAREDAVNDLKATMSRVISVTGFENPDGTAVTINDLKELKLDYLTLKAISEGYYKLALNLDQKVDLEKKDSKNES